MMGRVKPEEFLLDSQGEYSGPVNYYLYFFSLAPVVCIEIYAYHVYAGSINVKVGTSAEKALLP